MLSLSVNGSARELAADCSLAEALTSLGFEGRRFAVAVDGTFVPRHRHGEFRLGGGEALEVLAPMQGG